MNLEIKNIENLDLDEFCEYLIERMQEYIVTSIDERQLERFDEYLNNTDTIRFTGGRKGYISAKEILINSTYNLITKKVDNEYNIEIDKNKYIYNTNAKFIDIVKLINYGNLSLAPYPIYDRMMNEFAENIQELWDDFIKGV